MIKLDIASYNTGNKEFINCMVIMYLFDFTYLVSLRATLILVISMVTTCISLVVLFPMLYPL